MKKIELTKEQKKEIEKFGANTWFVEDLYLQFKSNPESVPDQWRSFFTGVPVPEKKKSNSGSSSGLNKNFTDFNYPQPGKNDEVKIIAGSAARILDNMNSSLTVPTATSQRVIPVKLLEENRILINNYLKKKNSGKVSFTHIIAWAIIKAIPKVPALNYVFSIVDGKPALIKRTSVNIGLAIDIEKKDGSHSLIVPNIKNAQDYSFKEFWEKYEDLVSRSRKGLIDPMEFLETTITLTNPGTIGTSSSIPRLMIGQGAIIATGAIQYPTEYSAVSKETISILGISKIMNITSTYDHRIIQGAESGLFLKEMNDLLLGNNDFYDEIFDSMKIPFKSTKWNYDYQPGIFDKSSSTEEIEKQARVLQLINYYRVRGHLIADLDPLGARCPYHPELDPANFKFTIWDLDRHFITGGLGGLKTAPLRDILDILQKTYCEKIGVEYMHIQNPDEKLWLQSRMEPVRNKPEFDERIKKNILNKLIQAESFEHFIHKKFIGHKRFSLEGSETLIPVLDNLLNDAADNGILEIVLGMAHRGRLNVLANIIGKPFDSILSEFEDIQDPNSIEGSGDVKYHLGATGIYKTLNGKTINVSLGSNPSHLEWVNPVIEGIVRAKQTRMNDSKDHCKVMAVLIHGDAAFAGQGVVAETLNLSLLSGYRTGGTIHIIINNQIGFTTTPEDARSSVYATDVAKMIQAPIFHVNGDDPEASLWVTKLALEYRQKFKKDIVIDLFGYRKHGHNEGDEPGFTQPLLYEKIKSHPSVRSIYESFLNKHNVVSSDEVKRMEDIYTEKLNKSLARIKQKSTRFEYDVPLAVSQEKINSVEPLSDTSISEERLVEIINAITKVPENFNIHTKLSKFLEKRKGLIDNSEYADWALAEAIAFGSLLIEGTPVRLSGQDSVRGTFSQRHLALMDMKLAEEYLPLNHIKAKQAKIEALDSFLSEAAVLGFEYGYSTADPLALVIWEAQFGDFANGAQVIIDNFISSSYEKWKLPNSVVMLLPHGYEGQGPEHSSARLERFLILCAQNNMQVCYPSTPAQYFHLLRRQIRTVQRKPLIIMTPKSLLRLPEAKSPKEDFISGRFLEVLDDNTAEQNSKIDKLVLTSGKIFYELDKFRKSGNISNTAIVRVEQFYPYPSNLIEEILNKYKQAKEIYWVQEEPKNMGAWSFVSQRLFEQISNGKKLKYIGRPESASPAVGSAKISNQQQAAIINEVFG